METLASDFIKRGAEISAGKQKDLAAYWCWILYLYGPQIREQLGTFRFLITELVPLQIILKGYRQDTDDTLSGMDTSDDSGPFLNSNWTWQTKKLIHEPSLILKRHALKAHPS